MSEMGWLDWIVLAVVIATILIWFARFIRRSLKAGCGKSGGCAGCSGCDTPPAQSDNTPPS